MKSVVINILSEHENLALRVRAFLRIVALKTLDCRMTTAKGFRLALHKKSSTLNAKFSCVKSIVFKTLNDLLS